MAGKGEGWKRRRRWHGSGCVVTRGQAGSTNPSVLSPRAVTAELQCLSKPLWLCVHSTALFRRHWPEFGFSLHPVAEIKEELCGGGPALDGLPWAVWLVLLSGSSSAAEKCLILDEMSTCIKDYW